ISFLLWIFGKDTKQSAINCNRMHYVDNFSNPVHNALIPPNFSAFALSANYQDLSFLETHHFSHQFADVDE
ncbi:MAG: hypothetical protein IKH44_01820, partial [Bacteroidales bacterium]|nr:hypothetical protein [Bacteroidales bacterium]